MVSCYAWLLLQFQVQEAVHDRQEDVCGTTQVMCEKAMSGLTTQ